MKRRAILIGHIDGIISTNADLDKVYNFLHSNRGGAWECCEIIKRGNIPLAELETILSDTRKGGFDFALFYFSGHGEYVRGTSLELNPNGEEINEQALSRLAMRQLNIFDCCRKLPERQVVKNSESVAMDWLEESYDTRREICRQLYDSRNMAAAPQIMSLYACSVDEYAHDFGNGGIYTNYLIHEAKNINTDYGLVSSIHAKAAVLTAAEALLHRVDQNPDYFMAKLPSRLQLVLSVNENISLAQ